MVFFLAFEVEGFELWGGGEAVATGDDGWACCLASVTTALEVTPDVDLIVFEGDESGDFSRGELGPLRSVSSKVYSKRSSVSLVAQAFCLKPLGTGGGEGFMASVATKEAT